ncbi:MAG: transcriptional regulator, partial [Hyphomicrobium sp.]
MKRGPAIGSASKDADRVVAVATKEWGGGDATRVPDWVLVLAETCDAQSLRKVADRLGYSASVLSRVLNGKYDGDIERVAEKVRGALLGQTVMCPVVDEIARDRCLDNQKHG